LILLSNFFKKKEIMTLLFGGLFLRMLFLIMSLDQIGLDKIVSAVPDSVLYLNMAKSLLAHSDAYEYGFFIFGPGYAYFLAGFLYVFGESYLLMIFLNIIFSTLICVFIYQIAMILLDSRPLSFIAGLLAVTSYTSISLGSMILSDTFFVFLFSSGMVVYLTALKNNKLSSFIFSGIIFGIAILVRSIGQFWPLFMLIIAYFSYHQKLLNYRFKRFDEIIRRMKKPAIAVLIAVLIVTPWIVRNKMVHGIATSAFSRAGGPANVAAFAMQPIENKSYREISSQWVGDYLKDHNKEQITQEEHYQLLKEKTTEIIKKHPYNVLSAYWTLTWENLNEICSFHRILIPEYSGTMIRWEHKIKDNDINYLNFYISMLGILILIFTRRYFSALVLGSLYFYYVFLIGFTRWQGSRLFFPGQIAWSILIAVVIVSLYDLIHYKIFHKKTAQ